MEPIFIKADLSFDPPGVAPDNELGISAAPVEYFRQNISPFGCMGLPWGELDPRRDFGTKINVQVRSVNPGNLFFSAPAWIIREFTVSSEQMGLRFDLTDSQRDRLAEQIKKHGFHPTEVIRKYPRIPSTLRISTFPLHVVGVSLPMPVSSNSIDPELSSHEGIPIIYDVLNLSPNGILLSSENQLALQIAPGSRMTLTLEPRGPFPYSVRAQALVCRITDTIDPTSGNVMRMLGVKFAHVDAMNRAAFLDLLRDILDRLKTPT